MKRSLLSLVALFFLFGVSAAEDMKIVQVVLLSRHGVRSATSDDAPLPTREPWPKWEVAPGALTPHGAQVATLMGGYYRDAFAQAGLLEPNGCPRANEVFAWSDVEERTIKTAQSILDGMYPACGLKAHTQPNLKEDDPLFHPDTAGVCKPDGATARNAIVGRMGTSVSIIGGTMSAYAAQFNKLQSVVQWTCAPNSTECSFQQMPSSITPEGKLKGPIPIASTVTEIFLLQYADGLPMDQVAWGRADEQTITYLLQLHGLQYDLSQRTFYPAQEAGSNLLAQMLSTLRARVSGKAAATNRAPTGAKFVLFAGHDTNIANLGGMLNIDWALHGYERDATPPDGALAFELLRGRTSGKYFVRLRYYAQTPDQLRNATKLDTAHPAEVAAIGLPGCVAASTRAGTGLACPWPDFQRIVSTSIDRKCVGSGKKTPLKEPQM